MKDPDTNIELTNSKSIRNAALNYCSNLLQNRDPKPEFAVDINAKKSTHIFRMNETVVDDVALTRKMFDDSMDVIRLKKKDKYKFIANGGTDLLDALFELCLNVWNTEENQSSGGKLPSFSYTKARGRFPIFHLIETYT